MSDDLHRLREALFAKTAVFDVDVLDRVRGGHGAAVFVAVGEVQGVSELVHGLDEQAVGQQVEVGGGWPTPLPRKPEKSLVGCSIPPSFGGVGVFGSTSDSLVVRSKISIQGQRRPCTAHPATSSQGREPTPASLYRY